jgi:Gylcosyl hydrolase family 115 C-terminal domain
MTQFGNYLSSGNSTTRHSFSPGSHTPKIWIIAPMVVFQKRVIDLGGVRPNYLGAARALWLVVAALTNVTG